MRNFLSLLLALALLLFLYQASNTGGDGTVNVDLQPSHDVEGFNDTKVGPWASLRSASYIIKGLQNAFSPHALRLMGAIRCFIPRIVKCARAYFKSNAFTDITYAMKNIVRVTATFRSNIQDGLDAHGITLDTLTKELMAIFMEIVHKLEKILSPSKAPGHAERDNVVNMVPNDTESALVNLAKRYGIKEEIVTTSLETVRPHVRVLTVSVGGINEQHLQLLLTIAFCFAALLIPESWILRPFLRAFGFGPAGPMKCSAAARLQRHFSGATVKRGSWFALLQAAGMGVIPMWASVVTKALLIGGLLVILLPYFRRG